MCPTNLYLGLRWSSKKDIPHIGYIRRFQALVSGFAFVAPLNNPFMLATFTVFQFDVSGAAVTA